MLQGIFAGTA
jgi:hypothetical protein